MFWFHNHSGRDFNGRNPAWLSGGVERDGHILWSEPEIVLYSNEPPGKEVRYSYPDLIETDGRYWITTTQKTRASVHEVDAGLLEGLWGQLLPDAYLAEPPQVLAAYDRGQAGSAGAVPVEIPMPGSPNLENQGFSLEVVLDRFPIEEGLLMDGRTEAGQGMAMTGTGSVLLNDGTHSCEVPLIAAPARSDGPAHLVVTVDGGPNIITFMVNGHLCDGADAGQFGWHRFAPEFGVMPGASVLRIHTAVKSLRVYDQPLRTSQAVRLYQDMKLTLEAPVTAISNGSLLNGEALQVAWNEQGGITSVLDKKSGRALTVSEETGVQGFSLLVKAGDKVREIHGSQQNKPAISVQDNRCRMVWNPPLSDDIGKHMTLPLPRIMNSQVMPLRSRSRRKIIPRPLSSKSGIPRCRDCQDSGRKRMEVRPAGTDPWRAGPECAFQCRSCQLSRRPEHGLCYSGE